MKKVLVLLVLSVSFIFTNASASTLSDFDLYNDNLNAFVTGYAIDWSSAGSGMAQGLGDPTSIVPGTEFNFYFQAQMTGLNNDSGQAVTFPGMPTDTSAGDFEYTVVVSLTEVVTGLIDLGNNVFTAIFNTTGGTFGIYHDDTPDANVGTGSGFDDGDLAASGTINANQISSFTTVDGGVTGIGTTQLEGLVTFNDSDYLKGIDPNFPIFDFYIPAATLNVPADDSSTIAFFADGSGTFYPTIAVTENDLLFKVDASNNFSVVPEPSTWLLMGMGLLGLAYSRRQRKNS